MFIGLSLDYAPNIEVERIKVWRRRRSKLLRPEHVQRVTAPVLDNVAGVCRCAVLLKAITASSGYMGDPRMHHTHRSARISVNQRLQSVDEVLAALSAL